MLPGRGHRPASRTAVKRAQSAASVCVARLARAPRAADLRPARCDDGRQAHQRPVSPLLPLALTRVMAEFSIDADAHAVACTVQGGNLRHDRRGNGSVDGGAGRANDDLRHA